MRHLVPERRRRRARPVVQPLPDHPLDAGERAEDDEQPPMAERSPIELGGHTVEPGRSAKIEVPIAFLMSGTPVALPVLVLHGATEGPTLALTAAIHGDELCGVEIVRRVVDEPDPAAMCGTVIAVPVVNGHEFNTGDRYLPDAAI